MFTVDDSELLLQRALFHAKSRPDAIAFTQPLGGGRLDDFSFARMLDEARRMAAHLRSLGLPPKSQVALLSKNCAHFVIADLAIWMAGHVSVAIYPTLSGHAVAEILEHSEAKLLFVGKLDSWSEQRPHIPAALPCIAFPLAPPTPYPGWTEILSRTAPLDGELTRPADDLATLLYTSGSTGRPKGVMHSFRTMAAAAKGFAELHRVSATDRGLSYLPLAHAFERACGEAVFMRTGARAYFADTLESFIDDIKRARPTLFISVPRLWMKFQEGVQQKLPQEKLERLLKIPVVSSLIRRRVLQGLGLDQCRLAASGSAPLPGEVIHWYRRLGLELVEGYGMTENFSYSHSARPGDVRVGTVGPPCPGVEARISPDGEVQVKSPANMLGYFKDPEATKAAFTDDGWLRTGDRGTIEDGGHLRLTGRVKELFKTSKGKYVAPAPIENALNAHRHIELACVTGNGQVSPHAIVVLAETVAKGLGDEAARKQLNETLAQLLDQVNAGLEHHEKLAFLAVVKERWTIENGLLTPTMKIRRTQIEQQYATRIEAWYQAERPVVWD